MSEIIWPLTSLAGGLGSGAVLGLDGEFQRLSSLFFVRMEYQWRAPDATRTQPLLVSISDALSMK